MELINFYSLFSIAQPACLGRDWYSAALHLNLRGTVLVAPEGINLALCGRSVDLDAFFSKTVAAHAPVDRALLRRQSLKRPAYKKLKLKCKPEIVSSRFGLEALAIKEDPQPLSHPPKPGTLESKDESKGYLSPEEFHDLALRKDVCLVDLRNEYESAIGTFSGALRLPLQEFSGLPELCSHLEAYRRQRLLTFCTGGVRCEKAVPFLQRQGFQAFQLHGGILHYLERYGQKQDKLWEGECFVFDDRVALNARLEHGSYEWCARCGQPSKLGVCVICGAQRSFKKVSERHSQALS